MQVFGYYQFGVLFVLYWALFLVKGWALIDAILRPAQAFPAADKLTKAAWLWILGLTMATHFFFGPLHFLSLAGDVAALVYVLDVRPAVASMTRRR